MTTLPSLAALRIDDGARKRHPPATSAIGCDNGVCPDLSCTEQCRPHTVRAGECLGTEDLQEDDIYRVYSTLDDCTLRRRATLNSMVVTLNEVVNKFGTNLLNGAKLRIEDESAEFVHGPLPQISDYFRSGFTMANPIGRFHAIMRYNADMREARGQLTTQRFEIGEVVVVSGSRISDCRVGNPCNGFTLQFSSVTCLKDMFHGGSVELEDDDGHKYTAVYDEGLPYAPTSYTRDAWDAPSDYGSPSSFVVNDHDGRSRYLSYLQSLYDEYMRKPFSKFETGRGLKELVKRRMDTFHNARRKLRLTDPSRKKRLHAAARTRTMEQKDAATRERNTLIRRIGTATRTDSGSDVRTLVADLTALEQRIEDMDAVVLALSRHERRAERAALTSVLVRNALGACARLSERISQVQQESADSHTVLKRKYDEELRATALLHQDELQAADLRQASAAKVYAQKRLKSVFKTVRLQTMASRMCHRYEEHLREQERASQAHAEKLLEAFEESRRKLQDEFEARQASTAQDHRLELQAHKDALGELLNRPMIAISNDVQKYATQYNCLACYNATVLLSDMAIPSCDGMHGLCKDCFPRYVSSVTTTTVPQTFEEAFIPCYDAKYNGGTCNGKYSFHAAYELLSKTRRCEAGSSSEALDPAFELERWALAGHARALHKEFIEKAMREGIERQKRADELRNVMRLEGWNPERPSENRVYQCPRCGFGPVTHAACYDLRAHHGDTVPGSRGKISNACPSCKFLASTRDAWNVWNGEVPERFFETGSSSST